MNVWGQGGSGGQVVQDLQLTGNLFFSTQSQRILADLTSTPENLRLLFQTSVVNGLSDLGIIPNGTSAQSGFTAYNAAGASGSKTAFMRVTNTVSTFGSVGNPLALNTGGINRLTIDNITGDATFFNNLFLNADPTAALQAATKHYVDTVVGGALPYLPIGGGTLTGDLGFSGAGRRIKGDFSNAIVTNRLMFQTSTANSNSIVGILPSGTGQISGLRVFNNSDPTNSSFGDLLCSSTAVSIASSLIGTGTFLPLWLQAGGATRLTVNPTGEVILSVHPTQDFQAATKLYVDTVAAGGGLPVTGGTMTGNINFSGPGLRITGDFSSAPPSVLTAFQTNVANGATLVGAIPLGTSTDSQLRAYNSSNPDAASMIFIGASNGITFLMSDRTGAAPYLPLTFNTGGAERFRLAANANRFQADFSTTTESLKFSFQTSVLNGASAMHLLPNGTSTVSTFRVWDSSNPDVGSNLQLFIDGVTATISSAQTASAPFLPMVFQTGGAERMRISPVDPAVMINTTSYSASGAGFGQLTLGGTTGGLLDFQKNGALVGRIGTDATTYVIQVIDITYPLVTLVGGAERMRIEGAGNIVMGGGASVLNNGILSIYGSVVAQRAPSAAAGKFWNAPYVDVANSLLFVNQGNTGVILTDGATAWAANSDERLKDIIEPITNARAKVKMLRSVIGKYKTDEAGVRRPFLIAQDLLNALPEVISYSRLPFSEDETEYMSVEYANTVPLLVAAFNEQEDFIASLVERITALENNTLH